jgi:hypothetical protein
VEAIERLVRERTGAVVFARPRRDAARHVLECLFGCPVLMLPVYKVKEKVTV